MTTTDPKLIERIARAAELMVLAAGVIRDHASDAIRHYYGEDCDGHCLAEDLESAAELLPTAAAINEAAHQWQDIANTEWIDGRDVVLFAHGMEVSARYCPGEWSDDTPISPREYSGAVWSCFDDQFQFEIEETSSNPAEWHHGPVTRWREPTPAIEAKESQHG